MSLEQDIRALAVAPIFNRLDGDALRLVAFSGEKRQVAAGVEILRRGEALAGAFAVLSGSLIVDSGEGGSRDVSEIRAGDLFGDTALMVEANSPATLTVQEAVELLFVSRRLFRRVLSEYPSNAAALRGEFLERVNGLQIELRRVGDRLAAIDRRAARKP